MKGIRNFLDFVELRTKPSTIIPLIAGAGYTVYRYGSVKPALTLIFFAAMLIFDLATTAINNHIDSRKSGIAPHYSKRVSLAIIFSLGLTAIILGLYLASICGIVILLSGLLCFGTGVFYSFGPIPISRTPFGVILAVVTTGFFIPFITVEISHPMISFSVHDFGRIVISIKWVELLCVTAVTMPLCFSISAFGYANDISDMEEDLKVQRYTLVVYIGKKNALLLFRFLYVAAYLSMIAVSVLRILPLYTLVLLLTIIPVRKNIAKFLAFQDKKLTFPRAIISFLIISIPYTVCIWLGVFLPVR